MPDYITRMHAEFTELRDRTTKLVAFMKTDTFGALPYDDRDLMAAQHEVMQEYSRILRQRIERATGGGDIATVGIGKLEVDEVAMADTEKWLVKAPPSSKLEEIENRMPEPPLEKF